VISCLLVGALCAPSRTFSQPFTSCNKDGDRGTVDTIEITPYPLVRGKDAVITYTGTLGSGAPVTGGKGVLNLYKGVLQIYSETKDICTVTTCPVQPGAITGSLTQSVPWITPPGTYASKMILTDQDGQELNCVATNVQIVSPSMEEMVEAHPFTPCQSGGSLTISELDFTPDPPKKGQNLDVAIKGTVTEQVTGGKVTIKLYLGPIEVYSISDDLCSVLGNCPLVAGDFTGHLGFTIPSIAPTATYKAQVEITDQSGTQIGCIDASASVSLQDEVETEIA